jgi:hypothetical protein
MKDKIYMKIYKITGMILLLISTIVLAESTPTKVQRDLDFICNTQKRFMKKEKRKGADKAMLAYQKSKLISDTIKTPEAKQAISAMNNSVPTERASLLKQVAQDSGLKNWSCPELD